MTRHLLVRRAGTEEVVPEDQIPTEEELHRALTDHPELLPTEDFGFAETVVIGKEARLAAGDADLVLVDRLGRLALVEVKKKGNPDTRQVVAQLLDYAAAMKGLTLAEFQTRILDRYLAEQGLPSEDLRSFFTTRFAERLTGAESSERPDAVGDPESQTSEPGDDAFAGFTAGVSAQLDSGRFVLVVAAPLIPGGVERVLSYLNTQGLHLFAVEFSYFRKTDLEIFAPRMVVRPEPDRARQVAPGPFDLDAFLAIVPEGTQPFLEELLNGCLARGAHLAPQGGGGVSVVVRWKGSTRTVIHLGPNTSWLAVPKGNETPYDLAFATMRKAIQAVAPGILTGNNGWFKTTLFAVVEPDPASAIAKAIWRACAEVKALEWSNANPEPSVPGSS